MVAFLPEEMLAGAVEMVCYFFTAVGVVLGLVLLKLLRFQTVMIKTEQYSIQNHILVFNQRRFLGDIY